ncbi:uncharacterized protein LOC118434292 [Folsomia candida]|nr:uncharacterized protein LOC118434292 [Folsomia candida]
MGSGLQISRKANLSSPPPFHIFVAKITNMDEPLQFKLFEDLGSTQKINALKNLVTSTLVEFDHAKHQIDFLVDDVKETTYDSKNDTDLLYRLSEMYHCVVNISTKSQTNPTERTMAELKVICETMSKFVLSLNSFINASEHIMEKIMEVRDVVQLTYIYLQEEVKIDLSKLMPPDTPVRIVSKMGLSVNKKTGCCSGRNAKKRLKKDLQTPHYNGSDFHRVYYEDSFKDGDDTVVDGYVFRVRPAVQQKDSERRSKDYNVYPQIRFRHSEPNAVGIFGGGGNSHTTISGESLPGGGRADNSTGGTSNTLAVEETPLKPILKDVPVNSTPSPVGKLPRSPAGSIEMMPSLTKSKQLEEDDEPMLERKGKDSIIFKKDKDGSRKGSGGSNHS